MTTEPATQTYRIAPPLEGQQRPRRGLCQHIRAQGYPEAAYCCEPAAWDVRWRTPVQPDKRYRATICDRHVGRFVEKKAIAGGTPRGRAVVVSLYPMEEAS